MNGQIKLLSITVLATAVIILSQSAFAVLLPDTFYGSLTINGIPAPAGTQVRGMINGIEKTLGSPYFTSASGVYGSQNFQNAFEVQGDAAGQTITFEIKTPDMSSFTPATPTGSTFGGSRKNINLSVIIAQECVNGQTRSCGSTDVGACEFGTQTCSSGSWGACIGSTEPVAETCNNIDDDCDGQTDETFNVGSACSEGVGACTSEGIFICNEAGTGTNCNAVAGQPSTETCDNVDNNCDGTIDEQLVQQCGTTDVGACEFGTQTCNAGQWGVCQNSVEPKNETCNSIDDDCDGLTDETFVNLGSSCSAGTGVCQAAGTFVCSEDGSSTKCNAVPGQPSTETCDSSDNNCNGQTDEGFNVGTSCNVGVGACQRTGAFVCAQDGTAQCSVTPGSPAAELCGDGIDNDCDGQVDEGFDVGDSCNAGIGACFSSGTKVCSQDKTTTVCNAVAGTPTTETCDGSDNNCNGQTDEGFNLGASCTAGSGACEASGTFVCSEDGSSAVCNAVAGDGSAEVCDNVDNNCDGQVDEQLVRQCGSTDVGACEFGTQACSSGTWGACIGSVNPKNETCNSIDDDCDNQADETFNVGQACSAGTGVCQSAGTFICNQSGTGTTCNAAASQPQTEVCDNLDNDCNGQTDELGTQTCGVGACQATSNVCMNGNNNACVPLQPATEICNDQVDNDCDGATDSSDSDCQCINTQTLSVTTDKNIYEVGNSVIISGMLDNSCSSEANKQVGLLVKGPSGSVIFTTQKTTSSDGSYLSLLSLENAEAGEYEVQSAFNGTSSTKKFTVVAAEDENFCIVITDVQILNSTFSNTTSVGKGKFYNVKVSNANLCNQSVESMQIVQVMKGTMPINLGTVKSTISPGTTSYITLGFTMPQSSDTGTYNVNAFNWNHWIDEDPLSFQILSRSATKEFQVT
ncbi:MAG: hypothetical protein HY513_05665 [Candidatus Aenigmarchaeota archaeon]|nr:hypothetical protein [Candidatus Aenigmarchaeota archaeon]